MVKELAPVIVEREKVNEHWLDGIFIAYGPDVKRTGNVEEGIFLWDIAPTSLYLLGLGIPHDIDGEVLSGILKPTARLRRPCSHRARVRLKTISAKLGVSCPRLEGP